MPLSDRHTRLADLFDAARELPAGERDAFLARECATDPHLLDELGVLLRFHDDAGHGSALRQPIVNQPIDVKAIVDSAGALAHAAGGGNALAGDLLDRAANSVRIPGFRIIRVLGEGGMGVVYLAEQDKPRRLVAIKIMRPGATSPALLKRFDLEQELLGRLQHPGIAQIHETGVWRPLGDDGPAQPFFVMEFVQGEAITDFAQNHALATRERLGLLLKVCEAVQHAHTRSIIHRDLKPANILVTDEGIERSRHQGAESPSLMLRSLDALMPQPKILDFGVARATNADIQITSMHTGVGQLVGTLAYMSPEQASGDSSRIDARSDVYALGVIGYELLAGQLPHALAGRGFADAARVIHDEDASPLSLVNRVFRGDLDTIFAKALAREPERRYQSAGALALDVQRYLDDQPIIARPPSAIYNLRKFARRNQGLVAGVALAFVLLVAGVIGTTLAMLQARRAEAVAETEAETARAVTDFIQDMFGSPDPLAPGEATAADPKQTRVIDVLDHASSLVAERFAHQPLVEAGVRSMLGRTYSHLMVFDQAEAHLRRAGELYRAELGEAHPIAHDTISALGTLYMLQHRFDEAEAIKRQTLDVIRRTLGPTHPHALDEMEQLAMMQVQRMKYDDGLALLDELLTLRRQALGPEHRDTINTMYNIAWAYATSGRHEQALPRAMEVMELRRRVNGEIDGTSLSDANNVAWLHERLNQVEQAERTYAELVEQARTALPPGDWHLATFLHNHASALRKLKRYEEAEPRQLEAIAIFDKAFGPKHERMQAALKGAVRLYEEWGREDEAAKWRERIGAAPETSTAATQPAQ
jgi:serine/threonine protein kinase